jgi:hypothetical protein
LEKNSKETTRPVLVPVPVLVLVMVVLHVSAA